MSIHRPAGAEIHMALGTGGSRHRLNSSHPSGMKKMPEDGTTREVAPPQIALEIRQSPRTRQRPSRRSLPELAGNEIDRRKGNSDLGSRYMSSPKTKCSECGVEILQITADINGGFCMPCSNRKKRKLDPTLEWMRMKSGEPVQEKPQLETGAIIQATFSPGFATDLTSWETQITESGRVIQIINWWRPDSGRRSDEEIREVQASKHDIEQLKSLIAALNIKGVMQMSKETCVDDAELISFLIPSSKFHETISPYASEYLDRENRLSDLAQAGLRSFRAVWDHIESLSPYSTFEHWKDV